MRPDPGQSLPLLIGLLLIILVLFIVAVGPKPQAAFRITTKEGCRCF